MGSITLYVGFAHAYGTCHEQVLQEHGDRVIALSYAITSPVEEVRRKRILEISLTLGLKFYAAI